MAGLIGASNSPVSGVGILTVLGISLVLVAIFGREIGIDASKSLVAFALFVTAIIFGVATIANDNLQDLKTGQLVGATPWKQQVALIIGVIFGSLVIPPILTILNDAFGFVGAPGAGPNALAAPQAALISAIAQGVLGGNLDWNLIGLGALIGVGGHHRRRSAPPHGQIFAAPARGRHGHLSADVADLADPGRRDDRLSLQQVGGPSPRPGLCRAARRADGDRPDRRRKPVRRRLCRDRRRDRQ